jgi:hypothetical protein
MNGITERKGPPEEPPSRQGVDAHVGAPEAIAFLGDARKVSG